jgi:imidazolonepropionase-like amidohydrolase
MHPTEVALHREGLTGARWNPAGAQPGGYDARYQFVLLYTRALYDAGVRLLTGTDSPTVLGAAGFSLQRELELLHRELGLSPYQVLELATGNAGDFVHEHVPGTTSFGRIEVGRRADLLLLKANPLESLENVKLRVAVMARGRLYMADELQAGIEGLAARYAGG